MVRPIMHTLRRWITCLMFVVGLAACRNSKPVEEEPPPITPAEYCASVPASYCSRLVACGWLSAEQEQSCAANTLTLCQELEQQVTADAAEFDAARAKHCLDDLPVNACPDLLEWKCLGAEVFPRTGNAGSSCKSDTDCQDGFCLRVGQPAYSACNQCIPYRREGETCGESAKCDPRSTYCATDGASGEQRCRRRLATGVPCESHEQCLDNVCYRGDPKGDTKKCGYQPLGSPCMENECEPGAACLREQNLDGSYTELGVCSARIPAGQRCMPQPKRDQGCADRMPCVDGVCRTPHTTPGSTASGMATRTWTSTGSTSSPRSATSSWETTRRSAGPAATSVSIATARPAAWPARRGCGACWGTSPGCWGPASPSPRRASRASTPTSARTSCASPLRAPAARSASAPPRPTRNAAYPDSAWCMSAVCRPMRCPGSAA